MQRLLNKELFQLDAEIERTFRQRRKIQKVILTSERILMAERPPPNGQE